MNHGRYTPQHPSFNSDDVYIITTQLPLRHDSQIQQGFPPWGFNRTSPLLRPLLAYRANGYVFYTELGTRTTYWGSVGYSLPLLQISSLTHHALGIHTTSLNSSYDFPGYLPQPPVFNVHFHIPPPVPVRPAPRAPPPPPPRPSPAIPGPAPRPHLGHRDHIERQNRAARALAEALARLEGQDDSSIPLEQLSHPALNPEAEAFEMDHMGRANRSFLDGMLQRGGDDENEADDEGNPSFLEIRHRRMGVARREAMTVETRAMAASTMPVDDIRSLHLGSAFVSHSPSGADADGPSTLNPNLQEYHRLPSVKRELSSRRGFEARDEGGGRCKKGVGVLDSLTDRCVTCGNMEGRQGCQPRGCKRVKREVDVEAVGGELNREGSDGGDEESMMYNT
jgi:hypothetical protein